MKKMFAVLATLALLVVGVSAQAQAPINETLGAGTPATSCSFSNTCVAPVLGSDGTPDGTLEIHASTGVLVRYNMDGTTRWVSTDYASPLLGSGDGGFTHDDVRGSLTYTIDTKVVRTGEGRYARNTTYRWVSGGTLTE